MLLIAQLMMSGGIVLGFAILIPEHDRVTVLYLSTGAPTVALIMAGMVLAPQALSQQKLRGLFDYQRAMPVPRLAMLAADASMWMALALPAALLVALVAISVGTASPTSPNQRSP